MKNSRLAVAIAASILALAASRTGAAAEKPMPLQAMEESSPAACVPELRAAKKCPRWYELPEKANPDACIPRRITGEKCWRWYSYGTAPAPAPREEVIRTNKIHFQFDKSDIKPASYPVIDEIVATIKGRSDVRGVRVEGHTDSVGSDAYNQALSERRAASVREYLVSHGIPSEKVTSAGMGEGSPIADNSTKEGRAENRRTEFHLQIAPGAHVTVKKGDSSPTFQEGDPIPEGKKPK
jgi:outer membrane protein OmpA-like peptidoglycan-associated protein